MKKHIIILFSLLTITSGISQINPIKRQQKPKTENAKIDNKQSKNKKEKIVKHNNKKTNLNRIESQVEKSTEEKREQVFRVVDQMPQFPGGEEALKKFIQSHINYPPMAAENNIQGTVVLLMVIDKTGKVNDVTVARSLDKDLDREAVRVCESLPNFIPGRQNGIAVSVWYAIPVIFELSPNTETYQNKFESPIDKNIEEKEEVFYEVDQMPQYPGGEAALMKYLQSHIIYPPMAAKNKVHGRVVVQFVVDKTGKVGEVKVVRSVDEELDKEAVRVCKLLPNFIPGRQNGTAVSVWYTLPIRFILPNK